MKENPDRKKVLTFHTVLINFTIETSSYHAICIDFCNDIIFSVPNFRAFFSYFELKTVFVVCGRDLATGKLLNHPNQTKSSNTQEALRM